MEDQATSFQDIIAMADTDKNFFNKIITGDVLPMTPKQSDSSERVGKTFQKTNIL
jgi:hypothetical protein